MSECSLDLVGPGLDLIWIWFWTWFGSGFSLFEPGLGLKLALVQVGAAGLEALLNGVEDGVGFIEGGTDS